jgi:hypothetical protein
MLRDVLRELLPNWHKRKLIAERRAVGSGSENALQSLRRRIEMENAKHKAPNERSTMDNTRNAEPTEDQGVIVSGADARARAHGEVKDVRDAPTAPETSGASTLAPDTSKSPVANRDLDGPRKAGTTPRPTDKPTG